MNKIGIGIVVAVVVAAAAAGGWYFYTHKTTGNSLMAGQSSHGTLKDLMMLGTSKCTVSNAVVNSESTGTVYIGNGKMRGDFTTTTVSPAMTIESHMISDGEFMYTWSSAMPQGVKIAVSAANMTGQPNAPKNDQVEMYNADVNYSCDTWSVEESKFEAPKDVTFVDISTMMPGANAGGGTGNEGSMNPPSKSSQCNMCDSAPEPQRSQCRAALQCR